MQQQTQMQQAQENFKKSEADVRKQYPDYDEVVSNADDVILPQIALDAIRQSPLGAAIGYHLAKNPKEAELIMAMGPVNAVREIGKLEARIEMGKKSKGPKVSGAPDYKEL